MRIYGKFIGRLGGHTEDSLALVNRFVEIYMTKTKLKFYLFNSSVKGWHNPSRVLKIVDVKLNKDVRELISEYLNMFMHINNIRFNDTFTYEGVEYRYDNGVEVYEADNGTMLKDIDGKVYYHGDYGENGAYYKDLNAWNTNKGVIYISEYNLHIFDRQKKDITDSDCNLWTKQSWVEYIKEYIEDNYSDCDEYQNMISSSEFIEKIAYDCLCNADWQDLSTIFLECEYNDDFILNNWYIFSNKN